MLGQTTVIYTHTYTHSHTLNTFTGAQYSLNSHKKHTHSLKRWKPGKNVGWQGQQHVAVQNKTPISKQRVRQTAVGYIRKAIYTHTHTHTHTHTYTHTHIHSMYVCMYDCLRSESESASHSSPPQLKGVWVISAYVRARVCWQLSCMLIKVDKQKTDTFIHISEAYRRQCFHRKKRKKISTHACTCKWACMCPPQLNRISRVCECALNARVCVCCYYFANPSTLSVCLSVHVRPCVLMLVYTMLRCYPCATSIWC
jgi:hypothetical protein